VLVLDFFSFAKIAVPCVQTQRNRRISSPENSLITPGTDFMNAMDDVVLCYVLQRVRRPLFQNLTVYISGARQPGEGELKIVDWLQTHIPLSEAAPPPAPPAPALPASPAAPPGAAVTGHHRVARRHSNDSVVICGSDSDILLQALALSARLPRIAVLQVLTPPPSLTPLSP